MSDTETTTPAADTAPPHRRGLNFAALRRKPSGPQAVDTLGAGEEHQRALQQVWWYWRQYYLPAKKLQIEAKTGKPISYEV